MRNKIISVLVFLPILGRAASIGPANFTNPHTTTYDGLGWSTSGHGSHSTPVVIDGNTYTADTPSLGWENFNKGCGTPPTYQCIDAGGSYIDIALGTPARRAGAWIGGLGPGQEPGKPPTTGTLSFYDQAGALLGTVSVTVPGLYSSIFGGWQTEGNPISRIRITNTTQSANQFTIFVDNLTTDSSAQLPPSTGVVNVNSTPPGAAFQLAGPGLTFYTGITPFTTPPTPPGVYQLTWSSLLGGYTRPPNQSQTLTSGGVVSFNGTYGVPLPSPQTVLKPPYEFFNGCNATTSFQTGDAVVYSSPLTGNLSVNVRSTQTGSATGQAGVGITYTPTVSGTIQIKTMVQVGPGSFEVVELTGFPVPFLDTIDIGISTLESKIFLTATPDQGQPLSSATTFSSQIEQPIGISILPTFVDLISHVYNPAEQFSAQISMAGVAGVPIRICAGVQSKAVSATLIPLPFFAMTKALYAGTVLEIDITRQ